MARIHLLNHTHPIPFRVRSSLSITEANQNFSRVARMVDENGAVVILKNNTPRYLLIEFSSAEAEQTVSDEDVLSVSKRLLAKNHEAYEVLAK
ncbi:MAG: type II toxin-antitoxin system Phd/YefM family antitoxin [Lachnospiraceae bacterium]|nr:type II toxin-antitoxin system Phd/YefM family antitoxin [Lachnospiraceae bacterium]